MESERRRFGLNWKSLFLVRLKLISEYLVVGVTCCCRPVRYLSAYDTSGLSVDSVRAIMATIFHRWDPVAELILQLVHTGKYGLVSIFNFNFLIYQLHICCTVLSM